MKAQTIKVSLKPVKQRRIWGFNPVTRVVGKNKYSRKRKYKGYEE